MSPTSTKPRPTASRPRANMDPRISARRTAVTREQGRRRLRVLVGLLLVTALLVGGWYALHSAVFSARAITVVGATHETAAQVEAAGDLTSDRPLIDINTGATAAAIAQLPWVQSAKVTVHWPDGVRVAITEAVPALTMAEPGGKWAELSAKGRVLTLVAAQPPGLLVISGPTLPGAVGSTLTAADRAALGVASTLPASFKAQVTAVRVEPGDWIQLALTTPILVDLGTTTQLTAKYEDVSSILAGATLHDGDVIDVSVPDAPTVTEG
jgi:cell division septal protein FtsQ